MIPTSIMMLTITAMGITMAYFAITMFNACVATAATLIIILASISIVTGAFGAFAMTNAY